MATDNFSKTGLSIYPNPVKNEFFIKNSNEINLSKIQLADLTGKILLSQDIENTEVIAVPITNISSGIYLVLVEDASGNVYKSKLIIE